MLAGGVVFNIQIIELDANLIRKTQLQIRSNIIIYEWFNFLNDKKNKYIFSTLYLLSSSLAADIPLPVLFADNPSARDTDMSLSECCSLPMEIDISLV